MSIGRWIIAFAFGLAVSSAGYAQEQPATEDLPSSEEATEDRQNQGQYQQNTAVDITPALEGIERAIRDLEAEIDEAEQQRQRENNRRDLEAQERMALFAEYMFYATAVTVVLTFFALVAIVRTLNHTKRAADSSEGMLIEAQRTTEAAQKTLVVTNKAVTEIERPFVAIRIVNSGTEPSPRGHLMPVTFVYENHGRTPARLLWAHHKVVTINERNSLPPKIIPNKRNGRRAADGEIVSPGGSSEMIFGGPIINAPKGHAAVYQNDEGTAKFIGYSEVETIDGPDFFKNPTFLVGFVAYASLIGDQYIRGFCFEYERAAGGFRLTTAKDDKGYNYDVQAELE